MNIPRPGEFSELGGCCCKCIRLTGCVVADVSSFELCVLAWCSLWQCQHMAPSKPCTNKKSTIPVFSPRLRSPTRCLDCGCECRVPLAGSIIMMRRVGCVKSLLCETAVEHHNEINYQFSLLTCCALSKKDANDNQVR